MKFHGFRPFVPGVRSVGRVSRRLVLSLLAASIAIAALDTAFGRAPLAPRSGGISGYSGERGVTCNRCHFGGTAPIVKLDGPVYVSGR